MADQRISQLTALLQADVDAVLDQLPIADTSTAETKKVTPAALVLTGVKALPAGTIPGSAIVGDSITAAQIAANAVGAAELADLAVDTAAIVDLAVTSAKIANDAVTAAQIATGAVGATELAAGAVGTAALVNGAVAYAKIQNVTATDKLLGRSSAGAGVVEEISCTAAGRALLDDVSAADQRTTLGLGTLATQSGTFSGTHSGASSGTNTGDQTITLTGAVTGTGTGSFATSISAGAVNTAALADGAVTAAKIASDSITAAQIAPDAVGASELANNAVDTGAIADGAVTSPKIGAGAVGTTQLAASGVTAAKVAAGAIGTTQLADAGVTAIKMAGDLSGAAFAEQNVNIVLAGPATGGVGKPTFRALSAADLPTATSRVKGAVSLLSGGGLSIGVGGELSITNAVVPATNSVVTYDSNGLVTGGRALTSADLPKAAAGAIGAVKPGAELTVATPGTLDHVASAVVPGTYTKINVNQYGHVTAGQALAASDIPPLDATTLNTGLLNSARIADRSISDRKLDNYSISYIQEAPPTAVAADHHIGQLWYQESTAQLFMWNGNSWMQVGSLGRLGAENMRFSGTWDAAAGQTLVLTAFGKSAGLTAAVALPAASDALTGVYLVTTTPGTYNTVPYDNGDWVLCLGATAGWVRVDTLSSAGSSTISLKDLLDVNIPTPGTGDALIFDGASNRWVNRPTSAVKTHLTPTFDGIRTSFQLAHNADHENEVLLSLGGVIQNPGTDFTLTGARKIDFATPPPTGLDYWVLLEGMPSTAVGGGGTTLPPGTAAEEVLQWNATLGSWQPSTTISGGVY